VKKPTKKKMPTAVKDDRSMPVWLQATRSFYVKLNRVATECGHSRYDTLTRGLDALLRETRKQQSPLNKKIKRKDNESLSARRWVRSHGDTGLPSRPKRNALAHRKVRMPVGADGRIRKVPPDGKEAEVVERHVALKW
jgi:hypothetical protein